MISSLKIKLNSIQFNPSSKLGKNWNVPLVLLERSWWEGFNGIYLVRFGFRMWEILIFKWFLSLKIQIIFFLNQVLEGKISWQRVNTWATCTRHEGGWMVHWWDSLFYPCVIPGLTFFLCPFSAPISVFFFRTLFSPGLPPRFFFLFAFETWLTTMEKE